MTMDEKSPLEKAERIAQAVMDNKLTNFQAADLLGKLCDELKEKRREAHANLQS